MQLATRTLTRTALAAAALAFTLVAPDALAASGHGGKPTVEREVVEETYFDDFIYDLCGVETNTTLTQRITIKTFPDGTETVHSVSLYVPDDPSIASERNARTDIFAPDGTYTIKGLGIRLFTADDRVIVVGAGWLRVTDDGMEIRGPDRYFESDPVDLYC